MRLAHSTLTGGHFSHKKTSAALKILFTWPGIGRDVQNWCSTCPRCQKAVKRTGPKAPMKPLPVIKTLFHRIAFDLVGTLPRTKRGHQSLLTCICLSRKYPEAIPLKRVDAVPVAKAMVDVFSRIGIPYAMLTDQGSVFMGRLTKELCGKLNIDHLRISPYHPQMDGSRNVGMVP